jgi:hypothetical protein
MRVRMHSIFDFENLPPARQARLADMTENIRLLINRCN